MKTLEEIRGRCFITEDGHWLWRGAVSASGRPNIHAPNYTKGPDVMGPQCGTRAVWHCHTLAPIPKGWRAYGICSEKACCNPDHIRCTSQRAYGAWVRRSGKLKGDLRRTLMNRATGRARSVLVPEVMERILTSKATGVVLAKELGISETTVSKARRGGRVYGMVASGGMFAGLVQGGRA